MTLEEKLNWAAKAIGLEPVSCRPWGVEVANGAQVIEWAPHLDDGDSRRLEIACINWMLNNRPNVGILSAYERLVDDRSTAEKYRAGVLDLAVEIGIAIDYRRKDGG